jgi:hypothetical protein
VIRGAEEGFVEFAPEKPAKPKPMRQSKAQTSPAVVYFLMALLARSAMTNSTATRVRSTENDISVQPPLYLDFMAWSEGNERSGSMTGDAEET